MSRLLSNRANARSSLPFPMIVTQPRISRNKSHQKSYLKYIFAIITSIFILTVLWYHPSNDVITSVPGRKSSEALRLERVVARKAANEAQRNKEGEEVVKKTPQNKNFNNQNNNIKNKNDRNNTQNKNNNNNENVRSNENNVRNNDGNMNKPPIKEHHGENKGKRSESAEQDAAILKTFFLQTNGKGWKRNNAWNTDRPLGQWYGVSTDKDGRVIRLDLNENHLQGRLPAVIGQLETLQELILDHNQLTGVIPATLRGEKLRIVNLSHNKLQGHIPGSFCDAVNIRKLYLGDNELNGVIPECLVSLHPDTGLDLSQNKFQDFNPASLNEFKVQIATKKNKNKNTKRQEPEPEPDNNNNNSKKINQNNIMKNYHHFLSGGIGHGRIGENNLHWEEEGDDKAHHHQKQQEEQEQEEEEEGNHEKNNKKKEKLEFLDDTKGSEILPLKNVDDYHAIVTQYEEKSKQNIVVMNSEHHDDESPKVAIIEEKKKDEENNVDDKKEEDEEEEKVEEVDNVLGDWKESQTTTDIDDIHIAYQTHLIEERQNMRKKELEAKKYLRKQSRLDSKSDVVQSISSSSSSYPAFV